MEERPDDSPHPHPAHGPELVPDLPGRSSLPPTRQRVMTPARAVFIAASALFSAWAGIWILLIPALIISDADSGRFERDMMTIWAPEFGLACVGAVYCLVMLASVSGRLGPRTLVLPAVLLAAIIITTAVIQSARGG